METQNFNLDELVRQVAVAVNKKCCHTQSANGANCAMFRVPSFMSSRSKV